MWEIVVVFIGGGVGAVSRYLISQFMAAILGSDLPYGTLVANIVGCFIIGAFMTLATEKLIMNPQWRLLIAVGFVGGLTTFSSLSYETFKLLENANLIFALYNVAINLLIGFSATWGGIVLVKMLSSTIISLFLAVGR